MKGPVGRISPGPTRWPPGAERRLVPAKSNLKPQTGEVHTWGCDTATIRWLPLEGGATRLTVAHFKDGGPTYNDALAGRHSLAGVPAGRQSGAPAPHALHQPRRRTAPGAERSPQAEGRVGGGCGRHPAGPPPPGRRGRVPVGCYCAAPHRAPHVYDAPPKGHPGPAWDDLIAASHEDGIVPDDTWQEIRQKTLSRDYRRCVRARLPEPRDPLRQRWDDIWLRVSAPGCRPPTSHTPATSAGNALPCPPPRRWAPTGARSAPRWPRAPGPYHPQASPGARKKGHCTGALRTRKPPRTATRAPRVPPSCGSTCTCATPRPWRTCRTCLHPEPRHTPRLAEPTAPCLAEGGTGGSTPEPTAERRRRPSGA